MFTRVRRMPSAIMRPHYIDRIALMNEALAGDLELGRRHRYDRNGMPLAWMRSRSTRR